MPLETARPASAMKRPAAVESRATTLAEETLNASVGDRMSSEPVTISTTDTCQWALRVMNAARVTELLVREGDRVVGTVRDREIYQLATHTLLEERRDGEDTFLSCIAVGGVMTYAPVTISRATSLRDAVQALLQNDISSIPVIDEGRVIGIFTASDALRFLSEALRNGASNECA